MVLYTLEVMSNFFYFFLYNPPDFNRVSRVVEYICQEIKRRNMNGYPTLHQFGK
jgi:hypothetical protein